MPNSMTGYGQAKAKFNKREFLAEFRTVNHRHFDFSLRLPNGLSSFEGELRQVVQGKVKRGKVSGFVGWEKDNESGFEVDRARVKKYVHSIKQIARELKLNGNLSISDLAHLPNVFTPVSETSLSDRDWPVVRRTVEQALKNLIDMRAREGSRLAKDIQKRLEKIRRAARLIKAKARGGPAEYKARLEKRIQELSGGLALDPNQLAKEAAFFADRSDITEELVRLDHHLQFFKHTLGENGEIGKRLDFISQEIHREANTIASKAANFPISRQIVAVKAEVEKIREQVQNIE